MNEFFDPDDKRHDTDMATLLQTLPDAPDHGDDFWASLAADFDAVDAGTAERRHRTPRRTRLHGRTQFMLVAAALVMVAGAVGIAVSNQDDETITTADAPEVGGDDADANRPTIVPDPSTTSVPAEPLRSGDRPFVDTGDGTLVGETDGYYVDERFSYDLLIPEGFRVEEFSSVYGAYLVNDDDPTAASISTTNLLGDDALPSWSVEPQDGETLTEASTVERPLFTSINDSVEQAGTFRADLFEFDRGGLGQRVVQIVRLEDRVIVVEIVENGQGLFPAGVEGVLIDAFRFYDDPEWIADCSTSGLPALPAPADLNAAQAARYEAIMEALATCDLPLLGEQLNPQEFFGSIAGDPALPLWTRQERFGDPILRTLYDFLALPVGVDETGEAQWPRGWATIEGPDDETIALLIEAGYVTPEELPSWAETGYIGWRTGIDASGNWNYFLIGD